MGVTTVFTRTYCITRGWVAAAAADGSGTPAPVERAAPADGGGSRPSHHVKCERSRVRSQEMTKAAR
eukprot:7007915-Alexandrium_andersonii.AAC.1